MPTGNLATSFETKVYDPTVESKVPLELRPSCVDTSKPHMLFEFVQVNLTRSMHFDGTILSAGKVKVAGTGFP